MVVFTCNILHIATVNSIISESNEQQALRAPAAKHPAVIDICNVATLIIARFVTQPKAFRS